MLIKKFSIENFRLLKKTHLDLRDETSLLVGKNNSGKTSLLVLFEKFYEGGRNFTFDDFSIATGQKLKNINAETNVFDLSIKLILEIEYNKTDKLNYLSEFILDLDPEKRDVKILFECSVDKANLLKDLQVVDGKDKSTFISKNIKQYLSSEIFAFSDYSDLMLPNRSKLIKKELKDFKNIVNFQIIHAKRDVASSESSPGGKRVLSTLTTSYFNTKNKSVPQEFKEINELILKMDQDLNSKYDVFFDSFLKKAKQLLNVANLKVISNLESQSLVESASKVVYGDDNGYLPEHQNGLGYMNLLYLLLMVEIKKDHFIHAGKNINLLFIEEPEAHTHPQMQYIFSEKIDEILDGVANLQTVITTHSSHIVSRCNFEDLRYLQITNDGFNNNSLIKNFHTDLKKEYQDAPDHFSFITQYLTLQSSELFFADKAIFIEGTTERILYPYLITSFEKSEKGKDAPLSSQNITVLEVGANAKAFHKFIDFLGIRSLIVTDFDTVCQVSTEKRTSYNACKVAGGQYTSNATLQHFFKSPGIVDKIIPTEWYEDLKSGKIDCISANIKVAYQLEENKYHARSFEDSFISHNLQVLKENLNEIRGLKNEDSIDEIKDIYDLTEKILEKKSDFASSLLFLALTKNIEWKVPQYITDGFLWLAK